MSESRPAPHPEPPPDLASRDLPLIQIKDLWFRIHKSQYSPLYYGLWRHPENVDGIYYCARHDPSRYCAAIFDRTQANLTIAQNQECWSNDFRETLAYILDTYGFGLV